MAAGRSSGAGPLMCERGMTAIRQAIAVQNRLGETPLWCMASQSLWWIDIEQPTLHRFWPATGRHEAIGMGGRFLGSLALCDNGDLLIGRDLALGRFRPVDGSITPLCQVEAATLDHRLNDGRCDHLGRFWVGTMDNELREPLGSFYRIDPDGSVHRQFGDIIVTNTVAISLDNRTL